LEPGERNANKAMSNNTILLALKRMGYQGKMTTGTTFHLSLYELNLPREERKGFPVVPTPKRGFIHNHVGATWKLLTRPSAFA
jgi:hypothetical protein